MKLLIKQQRMRLLILLVCLGIVSCTRLVNAQNIPSSYRHQVMVSDVRRDEDTNDTCEDTITSFPDALQNLAKADVVYLGETHDRLEDHHIQLQIIQELQQRNRKIAIAMEMFVQPYQNIINRYLAGKLTEQELVEQSNYQQWGYPWEYYAPIVRFAREKQLPILALNIPIEITRKVTRSGLESLTPQERKLIPPFSEIRTDNAQYRQLLANTFKQHQHSGHGSSTGFERFFLAQVLWDETMASQVTKFLKANPNYQVIVLAGQGHIIHGYGIPSRVARRVQDKRIIQCSILLSPTQEKPGNSKQASADFVWQQ